MHIIIASGIAVNKYYTEFNILLTKYIKIPIIIHMIVFGFIALTVLYRSVWVEKAKIKESFAYFFKVFKKKNYQKFKNLKFEQYEKEFKTTNQPPIKPR